MFSDLKDSCCLSINN